jgi:hypothetical protein
VQLREQYISPVAAHAAQRPDAQSVARAHAAPKVALPVEPDEPQPPWFQPLLLLFWFQPLLLPWFQFPLPPGEQLPPQL